jgi:hypothetical protein
MCLKIGYSTPFHPFFKHHTVDGPAKSCITLYGEETPTKYWDVAGPQYSSDDPGWAPMAIDWGWDSSEPGACVLRREWVRDSSISLVSCHHPSNPQQPNAPVSYWWNVVFQPSLLALEIEIQLLSSEDEIIKSTANGHFLEPVGRWELLTISIFGLWWDILQNYNFREYPHNSD